MKKYELADNWLTEYLEGWNYSNPKRYYNYMAIVKRGDDGNYLYEWLESSSASDEYFNLHNVNVGDILLAGCKDTRKNRGHDKVYYGVVAKDDNSITLVDDTTYLKVKKQMSNLIA